MSLGIPESQDEIYQRMRTDAQAIVPELNSGLSASFIQALLVAVAGSSFELFLILQILIDLFFLDTSSGDFLERWGSYKSITRNAATQADGFITASGVDTTVVPLATLFSSADGIQYASLAEATITAQSLSVLTITRVGGVATVTTASDHLLASGISVTISGANETEYNGTFVITVIDSDEFTYSVTGSPTTPATGTILAAFTTASIQIESTTTGQSSNQLSGVGLTVATPIAGLDDTAFVQFGEIAGGSDVESDDNLKTRTLFTYQEPFALFNVSSIIGQAKTVTGVTRVFVEEITPDPGFVTVFFTRDNDADLIPTAPEVTDVKNALLEIKPAYMESDNLIVSAPAAVPVNFVFTFINPNTSTMTSSIISNLDQFFREKTIVGQSIKEADYICAINETVDTSTGQALIDFTLTSPTGDITISAGEIGTLGTVTI